MLPVPRHSQPMAHDDTPPPTLPGRLRTWLARLQAALARAERHITENFRVPPHGG